MLMGVTTRLLAVLRDLERAVFTVTFPFVSCGGVVVSEPAAP